MNGLQWWACGFASFPMTVVVAWAVHRLVLLIEEARKDDA